MSTTTMPAWQMAALAAAAAEESQKDAERKKRREKAFAEAKAVLLKRLAELDIPADEAAVSIDGAAAAIDIDGFRFAQSFDEYYPVVSVTHPCAECDGEFLLRRVDKAAQLGGFMNDVASGKHAHWFKKDSTHPNAPQRDPWEKETAPAAEPTTEQRLLETLIQFVREHAEAAAYDNYSGPSR